MHCQGQLQRGDKQGILSHRALCVYHICDITSNRQYIKHVIIWDCFGRYESTLRGS